MAFSIQEGLKQIEHLKKVYKAQKEAFDSGKATQKPSIEGKTLEVMEKMMRNLGGDYSKGRAQIKEALTTTDTVKLIPKIIEGQLREAAEPQYLGSNFFQKVHVDGGSTAVYVIPIVGEIYASKVNEGGRYNESNVDFNTVENSTLEVRVDKVGAKVSITEEAISDSSWDILGINIKKMGRAMARYKEELAFNTFSHSGNPIFDNSQRAIYPEAGTTGRGKDGQFNDTFSVEDMLDMTLALMGNGFVPTDIIMHPLVWVVFARNSMIGNGLTFGAFGGNNVSPWNTIQGTPGPFGLQNNGNGQDLIMTPDQVQNRLPVPLKINFSPFVNMDKVNKRFDIYCVDRTEVGVLVQKEELSTEEWTDPERDIRLLKAKERYGYGVLNDGRAITVGKNIAVDVTYPEPPTVSVQNN